MTPSAVQGGLTMFGANLALDGMVLTEGVLRDLMGLLVTPSPSPSISVTVGWFGDAQSGRRREDALGERHADRESECYCLGVGDAV